MVFEFGKGDGKKDLVVVVLAELVRLEDVVLLMYTLLGHATPRKLCFDGDMNDGSRFARYM